MFVTNLNVSGYKIAQEDFQELKQIKWDLHRKKNKKEKGEERKICGCK